LSGKARHPSEEAFLAGDSLRALAAASVFFFHATFGAAHGDGFHTRVVGDTGADFGNAYGQLDHLLRLTPLAVYVFFSLSGYLLARRFIRAFVDGTPQPSRSAFVRNRLLRILPGLWFATGVSFLVFGVGDSSAMEILAIPLCVQVYIHGPVTAQVAHAWTVDTEWALYLGLPLLAFAIPAVLGPRLSRRGRFGLLIGLLGAIYVASLAFRSLGPADTYSQRAFWSAGWAFVPGLALAVIEAGLAPKWRGAQWGRPVALGMMGLCAAVAVLYGWTDVEAAGRRAVIASVGLLLLIGAPLVLQWTTGRCWRIFDNHPLRWLGVRSYSFYLLHFMIGVKVTLLLAGEHTRRDLLFTAPIALALTLVAAHLAYRFVEAPFLARKTRQPPQEAAVAP
jgi:peptidoglycan/LPS O-acetylase OafA/YrhL